jgi:hypothetical protein
MSDPSSARVAARHLSSPERRKTAAFPPSSQNGSGSEDLTSAGKRNIPKDHEFQARALKPLSKAFWASTVALGHTLTAYRHLSRLKSTTVSPDGLMGGRGYVMKLADMRQKLFEASEALSAISDTMFDEINAPHWKPKLAQLDPSDQEDVTRFVEEAQDVMENPEGEAEDEIDEIEGESESEDEPEEPKSKKRKKKKPKTDDAEGEGASGLPTADASQAEGEVHGDDVPGRTKEASWKSRSSGMSDRAWVHEFYTDPTRPGCIASVETPLAEQLAQAIYVVPPKKASRSLEKANSSEPVAELPGGPRVNHLGPGTGTGDYGDFNESESPAENDLSRAAAAAARAPTADEIEDWWEHTSPGETKGIARALKLTTHQFGRWNAQDWEKVMDYYVRVEEGDHRGYQRWRNLSAMWKAPEASAGIPDSNSDDTPTEAWDFGIGYGARGEGAGGYANPSGEGNGTKGVWGPQSGLPGTVPQSAGDSAGDSTPEIGALHRQAQDALYGRLPQDVAGDVARSDYYSGPKDNLVSIGTSEMPTPEDTHSESGQDLLNTYYTLDDVDTGYERYDFTTHTIRQPDGLSPGQSNQEPFAPDGEATR